MFRFTEKDAILTMNGALICEISKTTLLGTSLWAINLYIIGFEYIKFRLKAEII